MTIQLSPSSLPFGTRVIGNVAEGQVTVTGSGSFTATIASPTGNGIFTVTPTSGEATAEGVALTVRFTANQVGSASAKLRVVQDGQNYDVTLSGAGETDAASAFTQQAGSYLLIQVPDYGDTTFVNAATDDAVDGGIDPTPISGNTLQSYLRLGSFDLGAESAAAKELLKIIPAAGPARNPRSAEEVSEIFPGAKGVVYVDDVRVRAQDSARVLAGSAALTVDDDPDHGLTMRERADESAMLYARGGWRDHSDGNRISTTWGDKVEVVRGNYKMIVLGRQNDPGGAMGWEASGGHIQDYAPGTMPGASFWLEWIDDPRYHAPADPVGDGRKGLWLLVNTTENVYEYARTAGTLREEVWGDVHESYVGSETPPPDHATFSTSVDHGVGGHEVDAGIKIAGLNYGVITPPTVDDNIGKVRSNPHVIEKTWARRIDSHTGSEKCPVPKILEKTFADDIEGHTGSSSKRVAKIAEETWATETDELVDVSTKITSNTRAGSIFEATTAGSIFGTTTAASIMEGTTAGAIIEATTCALHVESHVGGLHVEIEVGIGHVEIEVGLKFELTIAAGFSVTLGEVTELRGRAKRELAKKKVALAMETLSASMKNSTVALDSQTRSMNLALNAIAVQIGL